MWLWSFLNKSSRLTSLYLRLFLLWYKTPRKLLLGLSVGIIFFSWLIMAYLSLAIFSNIIVGFFLAITHFLLSTLIISLTYFHWTKEISLITPSEYLLLLFYSWPYRQDIKYNAVLRGLFYYLSLSGEEDVKTAIMVPKLVSTKL